MGIKERKARQFQEREQAILAAAWELFLEQEFHLVSIDRIAERVEISKGTIYNHFASKEDIFAHLVAEWRQQMWTRVSQVPQEPPFLEVLRQSMLAMIRFNLEHPQAYQRFRLFDDYAEEHTVSDRIRIQLRSQEEQVHAYITRLLQGCIDEGSLPARNTDYMYVMGKSLIVGVTELLLHDPFSRGAVTEVAPFLEFALSVLLGPPHPFGRS